MLPASVEGQLVLFSNLDILPLSSQGNYVDYWGSRVASFEVLTGHKELSLTATSLVEVHEREHESDGMGWDELSATAELSMEAVENLNQTRRTEPPVEVIALAQDIAHLALGALRSAGIPARYVLGYLHPKLDAAIGETVTGESHAWIEWFCNGQWRGYDPTNLIDIGDRHVLVGRGRDYNDVPPLRGVYAGPFGSKLFVSVEITREA